MLLPLALHAKINRSQLKTELGCVFYSSIQMELSKKNEVYLKDLVFF